MKTKISVRVGSMLMAGAGLLACAEMPTPTEDLQASQQELFYGDRLLSATIFTNRSIPVCFQPNAVGRSDFGALTSRIKQMVSRSWIQATGLNFTGWGTCPNNGKGAAGFLNIDIHDGPAGGSCGPSSDGKRIDMNLVQGPRAGTPYADFEWRTMHEFAHALGFEHEFARTDKTADFGAAGCPSNERVGTGSNLGTIADSWSITNATYCGERTELSYWDTVGSQQKWGRPNVFADVTGDGKDDALVVNRDGVHVRPSTGSAFPASGQTNWTGGAFMGQKGTFFVDATGDGKVDAIAVNDAGVFVRSSDGGKFRSDSRNWTGHGFWGQRWTAFADVTGDGKADAIAVNADGVWVRSSDGTKFLANDSNWTGQAFWGARFTYFVDVTGDRRADAIAVNHDGVWVRPSDGTKFGPVKNWTGGPFWGHRGTYFADVSGDGKADAIAVNETGVFVRTSDGAQFRADDRNWSGIGVWGDRGLFFARVNADAGADVVSVSDSGIFVRTSDVVAKNFRSFSNWTNGGFHGLR